MQVIIAMPNSLWLVDHNYIKILCNFMFLISKYAHLITDSNDMSYVQIGIDLAKLPLLYYCTLAQRAG